MTPYDACGCDHWCHHKKAIYHRSQIATPTVADTDPVSMPSTVNMSSDPISYPSHYTQLPVECIDVTEHFGFCLGNAIKYIWRADHKGKPVEDLEKAAWYIRREIERRKRSEDAG